MLNIIGFLVIIGTVVTIHELGHFIAARLCGVGVLKFSIGFGPKIWSKVVSGTEYILAIIPLGGYVRMVGDMPDLITGKQATDDEIRAEGQGGVIDNGQIVEDLPPDVKAMIEDKSKWFIYKNYWQRSFIVFAGPLFNFILAYLIAVFVAVTIGLLDADGTRLGTVLKGSPAEKAGLAVDDIILKVNDFEVKDFGEIQKNVSQSNGAPIKIEVERAGSKIAFSAIPEKKSFDVPGEEKYESYMIGISAATIYRKVGFTEALGHSALWLIKLGVNTVNGMVGLVTGSVPLDSIGGPIMIYQVAGAKAEKGLPDFLGLLAYINLSLGILNLMPIPVLDGGHLLIFLVEALFGQISTRKKEYVQAVGMIALFAMMLIAFGNDLTRDTKKMIKEQPTWNEEEK